MQEIHKQLSNYSISLTLNDYQLKRWVSKTFNLRLIFFFFIVQHKFTQNRWTWRVDIRESESEGTEIHSNPDVEKCLNLQSRQSWDANMVSCTWGQGDILCYYKVLFYFFHASGCSVYLLHPPHTHTKTQNVHRMPPATGPQKQFPLKGSLSGQYVSVVHKTTLLIMRDKETHRYSFTSLKE